MTPKISTSGQTDHGAVTAGRHAANAYGEGTIVTPHYQHLAETLRLSSPRQIRMAVSQVDGFNAKVATAVTKGLGTMWCAWTFCFIALLAAPAAFRLNLFPVVVGLAVVWLSQCFIQLVALSVLQVGQNAQGVTSDARAQKTLNDTEAIIDALNLETQGGLRTILEAIEAQGKPDGSRSGVVD
jgi:hypothetical protein